MNLSIIVPAYNEESTIRSLLERVLSINLDNLGIKKQVVVVDDGSSDRTAQIVRDNFPGVELFQNPVRQGKGASIIKALNNLNTDIVLIQDADLEYNPKDYPCLLEPIVTGKAEVVYGSRFLYKRYPDGLRFLNYIGNRLGTWLVNLLYRSSLTDLMTCYKVFSQRAVASISLSRPGFDICPEITAKLLKKGFRIYEVPVYYQGRSRQQGKKIGLIDGFSVFWTLCRYRFCDC